MTVLGCWSPYPVAGGACSGYLVEGNKTKILLDCGNGVFGKLVGCTDFNSLDAVIITHLHPDHYMDLFCLRHAVEYALRTGRRSKPLKLYLPGEPRVAFEQLSCLKQAFEINKIENMGKDNKIGSFAVNFFPVKHPIPTYAVSVNRFVFSADTGYFRNLVRFVSGAGLFLCEASGLDQDLDYLGDFHLTARQAGRLGAEAGVCGLVITHFFPEYNIDELHRQAIAGWLEVGENEPNIEKASEGRVFTVPVLGR
ncbi:MAG TPA: MBL fold metallo-hydrolase [Clostridia bacterium]|nr:MBL fold metallo-hydrolase [Clostridia bacterium]